MRPLLLILLTSLTLLCTARAASHNPTLIRRVHRNNTGTVHDIFSAPNEDADQAEEPDAKDTTLGVDHTPTTSTDKDTYDSDFDHTWIPELIVSTSQWKHYCEQGRILCWHGIPTNFLRDAVSMSFYLVAAMVGPLLLGLTVWKGCMKWIWSWSRYREERRVRKRFLDFDVRQRRIRRMKVGMSTRPVGARPMPIQQVGPSTAGATRPRTMIGSTGRGNGRPLTMINTDLGGMSDLPRCSVLLSPRSSAQGAFGFGAGASRFNLMGPRAMPTSGNSSPLSDPLSSSTLTLVPGQILTPPISEPYLAPSPSRLSPIPGHSPVDNNSPVGLWPSEGFRSSRHPLRHQIQIQVDDSPRPFSVSTADSSTEEGVSSGSSPSDPRESLVSWASGASGSDKTLLTADQKRASLRTSWLASSHLEASSDETRKKKHNRLASIVGTDTSTDHLNVPTPTANAPRSILRPSVIIPRPPKLRVSFFAAGGANASSEALVGGTTPPNEPDTSLDTGNSTLGSIGYKFPTVQEEEIVHLPGGDLSAVPLSRDAQTLEKPLDATPRSAATTTITPRDSTRRRTLTDDIADLDPGVLHAFTARMKFRASAQDGAAWGWQWNRDEKGHAKKQVEKAVSVGRYRGRNADAGEVRGYPDSLSRRSMFGRVVNSTPTPTQTSTSWTQVPHQKGHWAWDKDGSAMGVGISPADYDVDEKIPKELRGKLYEMWGFSESGPYFR